MTDFLGIFHRLLLQFADILQVIDAVVLCDADESFGPWVERAFRVHAIAHLPHLEDAGGKFACLGVQFACPPPASVVGDVVVPGDVVRACEVDRLVDVSRAIQQGSGSRDRPNVDVGDQVEGFPVFVPPVREVQAHAFDLLVAEFLGVDECVHVGHDAQGHEGQHGKLLGPVNSGHLTRGVHGSERVLAGVPAIDGAGDVGAVEGELAGEGQGEEVPVALVEGRHVRLHCLFPDHVIAVGAELVVATSASLADPGGHAAECVALAARITGGHEQRGVGQVVGVEEAFRTNVRLASYEIEVVAHRRVEQVLVVEQLLHVRAIQVGHVGQRPLDPGVHAGDDAAEERIVLGNFQSWSWSGGSGSERAHADLPSPPTVVQLRRIDGAHRVMHPAETLTPSGEGRVERRDPRASRQSCVCLSVDGPAGDPAIEPQRSARSPASASTAPSTPTSKAHRVMQTPEASEAKWTNKEGTKVREG